jgi:hypothetical protein
VKSENELQPSQRISFEKISKISPKSSQEKLGLPQNKKHRLGFLILLFRDVIFVFFKTPMPIFFLYSLFFFVFGNG